VQRGMMFTSDARHHPLPHRVSPPQVATRLAANENPGFFRGMVKSKLGDISIVDEPGTLPSWYDSLEQSC
jgi:hypothetical protein